MIAHKHVFVFNNYDRSCTFYSFSYTFCACVYFAANVGQLSYLVIVLMGHTMVVNNQLYFLSLDLIPRRLTRNLGYCIVLYCIMRSYTEGRLGRYCLGIPRELSKVPTLPWLSKGSLTCDLCHYRGPIF